MSLESLVEEIKENKKGTSFTVSPMQDRKEVFIGVDTEDRPGIFILSKDKRKLPTIKTSYLKVEFSKKYKLSIRGNEIKEDLYHGILCMSDDKSDRGTFLSVMESLINTSPNLSTETISVWFHSLVNLFSVKTTTDFIDKRKGLWAELFFMKKNGGTVKWAHSWHSEPMLLFDFSTKSKRIEIKSTIKPERIHEFNHNQLFSSTNQEILVVSYLLREDDRGLSLKSLIDDARKDLVNSPDLIKLEKVARLMGMNESEEEGPKYNEEHAIQNEAWFRASDVPRFATEEPLGVTGTHYRSDLTTAPRLNQDEVVELVTEES